MTSTGTSHPPTKKQKNHLSYRLF